MHSLFFLFSHRNPHLKYLHFLGVRYFKMNYEMQQVGTLPLYILLNVQYSGLPACLFLYSCYETYT